MAPIADLQLLLRRMAPVLNAGRYVFATLDPSAEIDWRTPIAFVREPEGMSVVLEESEATMRGIAAQSRFAWITLSVDSDLQAVGLTAAFASALSHAGISCNVVAGANHDHIFVPAERASAAMAVLRALQQAACSPQPGSG